MSTPAKTLIDNAAKMCGSEAELARRIGTSPAALSHLKHGKREMSPETAALLADIAHMDAREAVIQAVIERNKTGPKAEQIREILGKALAAGVAAVLVFSYADLPTILHIVLSRIVRWIRGTIANAAQRVPHCFQSVKGKACGFVLTRSLRACGFRANP